MTEPTKPTPAQLSDELPASWLEPDGVTLTPWGSLGMTVDRHIDDIHDLDAGQKDQAELIVALDRRVTALEGRAGVTPPVDTTPMGTTPTKVLVPTKRRPDDYLLGLWVGAACGIGAVIAALGILEAVR
ncbi:hypothetical protein [Jiangella endophytica]|uniref:hypothetical protein n=1 Tax=Jiangella endophytica TaxID=1623398 RepID=UPI000E351C7F|nr:hypothetical protein [Jiangella endophytica]